MNAQTCIFDLDGVLVDSGVWHRAAWAALLDELGAEPTRPDYWRLTIGRPSEEAIPLLLGRAVPDGEAYRLARRKRDLYVGLSRQGLRAVPGAPTFVAELARRGVPRAVGTSASGWDVDNILAGLGLLRHFAVVVTADDVTFGKPDPEVYVLAARRLHAPTTTWSCWRRAPSGWSTTSRDSRGTRSQARRRAGILGGVVRQRQRRLGAPRTGGFVGRVACRGRQICYQRGPRNGPRSPPIGGRSPGPRSSPVGGLSLDSHFPPIGGPWLGPRSPPVSGLPHGPRSRPIGGRSAGGGAGMRARARRAPAREVGLSGRRLRLCGGRDRRGPRARRRRGQRGPLRAARRLHPCCRFRGGLRRGVGVHVLLRHRS